MCICINCMYVRKCATYEFIKARYETSPSKNDRLFKPDGSVVQINFTITLESIQLDWDVTECLSFVDEPGAWHS
uniref:Ycf34 n=1 Tax=Yamadaella caenomyce TaxID=259029 RepID=A0A1G4NYK5_9FLOR|nr:Hypothetical protein ycf34 [Yamadaella caenomyce]SCW23770.1 Hypothetical protein ycf34 [Yamadaella caenomyce]